MLKIKRILFGLLLVILFYTRFVNLAWGLPYPMHPDERNMAIALQQLSCKEFSIEECFDPNFFAYGQFPLYVGYGIVLILKFFDGDLGYPVSFEEAVFALRLISAIATVMNVFVLLKILKVVLGKFKNHLSLVISLLIFTFSPFFIQFSHFGTTESLLMFLYSLLVFFGIKIFQERNQRLVQRHLLFSAIFIGISIAIKVSSILFILLPVGAALVSYITRPKPLKKSASKVVFAAGFFAVIAVLTAIILSPHNLISLNDFLSSMNYESGVALGTYKVFYTRQFEQTTPIFFQMTKVFPYALGWAAFIAFVFGFFLLPYKKEMNFLRLSFLIYFLPNSFMFTKWTRFMAPIFPLMLLVAVIFLFYALEKFHLPFLNKLKSLFVILYLLLIILPGIAYLSVYQNRDVRFRASEWINKNVPTNSVILSETANVVDIPLRPRSYRYIPFDFYNLEDNQFLNQEYISLLNAADYIFVPSRRVFMNHTCFVCDQEGTCQKKSDVLSMGKCEDLEHEYGVLNAYYQRLFSGELGFEKVAEFSSFPKIELFSKTILEYPDENAEETWSVFDHPVVRIFKKARSL